MSHHPNLENIVSLSTKKIDAQKYYSIVVGLDRIPPPALIKKILTRRACQPRCVYVLDKQIYLFFAPEDDYLEKEYCKVVSDWLCFIFNTLKRNSEPGDILIDVNILQFATKTEAIIYLIYKSYNYSLRLAGILSGDENTTLTEFLKDEENIQKWEAIEDSEKYGVLYKLKRRGSKVVITSLCEKYDATRYQIYSKFIYS